MIVKSIKTALHYVILVLVFLTLSTSICFSKENNYPKGYCTWYAAEEFNKNALEPGIDWGGNAGVWFSNAKKKGWATTDNPYSPEIGSIIVWLDRNDTTERTGYGHVAVVNRIDWDKKEIYISEMNWGPIDPDTDPNEAKTVNFDKVTTKTLSINNLNRSGRVSTYQFQGYIFPRPQNFLQKDLLNAKYSDFSLVDGTYKNGDLLNNTNYVHIWVSKDKMGRYFLVFGDLDEDGKRDAVVITYTNFGGSGTFVTLNAFLNDKGKPLFIDAVELGQKNIKSIKIVDGKIKAIILKHGPNDPMCCPSILDEMSYIIRKRKIVSIN